MRKTRSDKGKKRLKKDYFNVTSSSTDKQIKDMLKKVNYAISTYNIPSSSDWSIEDINDIVNQAISRVSNILTFVKGNGIIEELELKNGKIPITQESADYIRNVLNRQEKDEILQKQIDSEYISGKKINDLLRDFPTFAKKISQIQNQLSNPDKYENLSDYKENESSSPTRKDATLELIARAQHTWDEDISDVIEKLYEDVNKNNDIIEELRSGKWTGDLLERANLIALGIETIDV